MTPITFRIFISLVTGISSLASSANDRFTLEAKPYLEIFAVPDSKCHILSEFGKLAEIKNNHPEKSIKYRLTRLYIGIKQVGLSSGQLPPHSDPIALGCTKVGGKDQTWEVERALFIE